MSLHHTHLMASDVDATIEFWRHCFGAQVVGDELMAGTRNVFVDIGGGRLNLYAKAPNRRGPVNHLGVQVADLAATVERLRIAGWAPNPIKTDGALSYSMVEGPDELLIEVFHFDDALFDETVGRHLRPYFNLAPHGDNTAGTDDLSPQAQARLARVPTEALRPPPIDDLAAVAKWRDGIHRSWLQGDPSAQACGHRETVIGGVRCLRASLTDQLPADRSEPGKVPPLVIYFHGGGYVLGSPEVSLPITERLAQRCEVISVDYRLAPEHPYPAGLRDGLAVLHAVANEQPGRRLLLAGDSAGANLALSLAQSELVARSDGSADSGIAGLLLFSPHLDHRPRSAIHRLDRLSDVDDVTASWLSDAYRGDRDLDDPAISPLLAEQTGLPPTLVQVGTQDSSFDDGVRFVRAAKLAGVDAQLDVWPGLWHTWHYHRELPEAARAIDEAALFAARALTQ